MTRAATPRAHARLARIILGTIAIPLIALGFLVQPSTAQFVDVTAAPLNNTGDPNGAAWGDYDNDGDPDLYLALTNSGSNRLFRNDAGVFVDVTVAPLDDSNSAAGCAWGDYDNDGDLDLYLGNGPSQKNKLFRNDSGVFVFLDTSPTNTTAWTVDVYWVDYDNDGDLDIFNLTTSDNELYRNDGNDIFVEISITELEDSGSVSRSAAWADYDGDRDQDLYLGNFGANRLIRNEGGGVFVDVTSDSLGNVAAAGGVAWGDYDGDSDLDLHIANVSGGPNLLLRNDGSDVFVDVTVFPIDDVSSAWGTSWIDYDHDGDLDLVNGNTSSHTRLFRNDGGGTFASIDTSPLTDFNGVQGVDVADYDLDGDLDLFIDRFGEKKLFRNDDPNSNHWLQIKLIGTISNRNGIGARVRVVQPGPSYVAHIDGGSGWRGQNQFIAHFGLGTATAVDSVIVYWPSGKTTEWGEIPLKDGFGTSTGGGISADQVLTIVEPTPNWLDISIGAGISDGHSSHSADLIDTDGDGDIDLSYPAFGAFNDLFRNEGGNSFIDLPDPGFGVESWLSDDAVFGDLDNDGDLDAYVVNRNSPNVLYRNDGGNTFVDVSSGDVGVESGEQAILGDVENDGDLDIYLLINGANILLRNEGGLNFVDATPPALAILGDSNTGCLTDLDLDGDLDLYVANNSPTPPNLVRNDGSGTFVDVTAGDAGDVGGYISCTPGDLDNDGDIDLLLIAFTGSTNILLRNEGGLSFVDATPGVLATGTGQQHASIGDLDNDGDLDIYMTSSIEPNRLFRNDGSMVFVDITSDNSVLATTGVSFSGALGDIDLDGDLDITVAQGSTTNNVLYENTGFALGNDWIHLKLNGTASNRAAIGARVRIVTSAGNQIREIYAGEGSRSQNSLPVEFGLGIGTTVDSVIVYWPSGIEQILTILAAPGQALTPGAIEKNQLHVITEPFVNSPPSVTVLTPEAQDGFIPGETASITWLATDPDEVLSTVDIYFVPDVVLYGTESSSGPGGAAFLYDIDATDGSFTLIGELAYKDGTGYFARRVGAVSVDPETGRMYATAERSSDLTPVLIEIDPQTAGVREIGETGIAGNVTGLSFDRETNILYGNQPISGGGASQTNIYSFDTATGAATLVGPTEQGGKGGALAHTLANKPILALNDQLYPVNLSTGKATAPLPLSFSAPVDIGARLRCMDANPLSGLMYGIATDNNFPQDVRFVQVNFSTGIVSNIGTTQNDLDGLAWGPADCVTIATGETNDGAYSWTVPSTLTNAGRIKIVATDGEGASSSDMSDAFFNILNNLVDVENPTGSQRTHFSAVAPNPFSSTTILSFGLAQAGPARLAVYDTRGRLVRELMSGEQPAGEQVIRWDGRDQNGVRIASGFYLLRLEFGGQVFHSEVSYLR